MIQLLAFVVLSEVTSKTSAFDAKDYIKNLPTAVDEVAGTDSGEAEDPVAGPVVRSETTPDLVKAKVTIKNITFVAVRSSFGAIYLPEHSIIQPKALSAAVCASSKAAPDTVTKDQPLTPDEAEHTAEIVKAIERQCAPGSKGT